MLVAFQLKIYWSWVDSDNHYAIKPHVSGEIDFSLAALELAELYQFMSPTNAAMLAAKRSAGVAPEVNLRILLHTGDEACQWGDPLPALKSRVDVTRSQDRGISGTQLQLDKIEKILLISTKERIDIR